MQAYPRRSAEYFCLAPSDAFIFTVVSHTIDWLWYACVQVKYENAVVISARPKVVA